MSVFSRRLDLSSKLCLEVTTEMKNLLIKQTIYFIIISLLCNEEVVGAHRIEPWKRLKKSAIKFVKGIFKESKKSEISAEEYDEYPSIYASPSQSYGYVVHDEPSHYVEEPLHIYGQQTVPKYGPEKHVPYGKKPKLYDEIRYDEAVNVEQGKKVWSGKIVIPNFLRGVIDDAIIDLDDKHVVKGTDNRVGFRLAVPFLGDFQYLREIGPGKYTDSLGPGRFKYPGINDKRQQEITKDYYKQLYLAENAPPPPSHGVSNYIADGSAYSKSFETTEEDPKEADPLSSIKNYPWYRRKR